MKDARQPVIDDESRGEVQLSAEEEAMLNEPSQKRRLTLTKA